LPIAGIDFVGPLPPDVQRITTFSAGVAVGAKSAEAARALIKYYVSPEAAAAIRKYGMEPISR
jgi:molybdate transport system substrate-binding protein